MVKVRIAKVKPRKLIGKKAQASFEKCQSFKLRPLLQVFRAWKGSREEMRNLRNPKFSLSNDEKCCAEKAKVSVLVLRDDDDDDDDDDEGEEGEVLGDGE